MSSSESLHTPSWHWYLLAAVGFSRFMNLGFLDLQAWDEALYTVRAQAIIRFGDLFDQSPHAIDGLYSSLHPPLYVWLTATMFQLFGESEWTARLVSALAGAATLPVIALLGKRLANPETGLYAALLFGLNPFVTFFARQGQFDTLLVFFLTLSAYFILKTLDEPGRRAPLLAGVSLGFALMTKLFVAIGIPVAVLFLLFRRGTKPERLIVVRFISVLVTAAIVSVPWHAFMALTHSDGNPLFFFTQSALLERTVFGIEGNVQPLEVLYYLNQLIVLFPAGFFFFLWGSREFHRSRHSTTGLLWAWFIVFFLVFSLMRTKLAVYTLPMFVPLSLLAASVAWTNATGLFKRKSWIYLLSGTSLFYVWSLSQEWRTAIKSIVLSLFSARIPEDDALLSTALLVIVGSLAVVLVFWMTARPWFPEARRYILFFLLTVTAGFSLTDMTVRDNTRHKDGAAELALFVRSGGFQRIVVAGYERNPQMTYYLDGADIDWRNDLSVRRIIPPPSQSAYSDWLREELRGEPSTALLVIEKDKFIRYQTVHPQEFVPGDYDLVLDTRRYSAYLRASTDFFAEFNRVEPFGKRHRYMSEVFYSIFRHFLVS